jgi:hypothetical protein
MSITLKEFDEFIFAKNYAPFENGYIMQNKKNMEYVDRFFHDTEHTIYLSNRKENGEYIKSPLYEAFAAFAVLTEPTDIYRIANMVPKGKKYTYTHRELNSVTDERVCLEEIDEKGGEVVRELYDWYHRKMPMRNLSSFSVTCILKLLLMADIDDPKVGVLYKDIPLARDIYQVYYYKCTNFFKEGNAFSASIWNAAWDHVESWFDSDEGREYFDYVLDAYAFHPRDLNCDAITARPAGDNFDEFLSLAMNGKGMIGHTRGYCGRHHLPHCSRRGGKQYWITYAEDGTEICENIDGHKDDSAQV